MPWKCLVMTILLFSTIISSTEVLLKNFQTTIYLKNYTLAFIIDNYSMNILPDGYEVDMHFHIPDYDVIIDQRSYPPVLDGVQVTFMTDRLLVVPVVKLSLIHI